MKTYAFWCLLTVNALFSVLLFAALPFGPDLVYAVQAVTLLGAVAVLGSAVVGAPEETMGPSQNNGPIQ